MDISDQEILEIVKDLQGLVDLLDEFSRLRVRAAALLRRIEAEVEATDKTPRRPPSQEALRAFQASRDYVRPKKK